MAARSPSPAAAAEPAPVPATGPQQATESQTATEAQTQDTIEAETDDTNTTDQGSESGDGYESDSLSATSDSLASSVRDYVFENNRRYHRFKEGRYLIPNDDIEQEREDMKHTMVLHVSGGKLHFAPLDHPQKVIDLGTGTGIWAIDMGDEYPSAEVIGVDLSPIQPSFVPPNVKFYVDDVESPWVDPPESVDYIHARHICMAIKDWPALLKQAYSTLVPGGWIELQELRMVVACDDGTMKEDYKFAQFLNKLIEGYACFNIDLLAMEKSKQLLNDGGFVNVQEKVFKIPVGSWAKSPKMKTVGMYNRSVVSDALQAVSMGPFSRGLHWTPQEVESYLVDVRKSLGDTSVHSYLTFHAYLGQKPTGV